MMLDAPKFCSHAAKYLTVLFCLVILSFDLSLIVRYARPYRSVPIEGIVGVFNGCDFLMRVNEAKVLREGIDPYKIWDGSVTHPRFKPLGAPNFVPSDEVEQVNAYTPWEYLLIAPFSFIRQSVSWWLWYALMVGAFVGVVLYAYRRTGMLGAACVASMPTALYLDLQAGNWPLVLSGVLALMVLMLERGHDFLAGLCWAIIMVKPQTGLLIAIPLLLRRRFVTCFTAFTICLALSLIASYMCRTSVITLLAEAPAASVHAFSGCGFFPKFIFRWCESTSLNVKRMLPVAMVLGASYCFYFTWKLRKCGNWLVVLAPAAVTSALWTYAPLYAFSFVWPGLFLGGVVMVKYKGLWKRLIGGLVVFVFSNGILILGKLCELLKMPGGGRIFDVSYDLSQICMVVTGFLLFTLLSKRPELDFTSRKI